MCEDVDAGVSESAIALMRILFDRELLNADDSKALADLVCAANKTVSAAV